MRGETADVIPSMPPPPGELSGPQDLGTAVNDWPLTAGSFTSCDLTGADLPECYRAGHLALANEVALGRTVKVPGLGGVWRVDKLNGPRIKVS